jgi:hypothetical protein
VRRTVVTGDADRAKSALSPADYLEKSSVMIVTSKNIVSSYLVGK